MKYMQEAGFRDNAVAGATTPAADSGGVSQDEHITNLILQRDAYEAHWASAVNSREFTKQWYSERLRKLEDLAKERGFWPEMAAIVANGSMSGLRTSDGEIIYDAPIYAQQLNSAKHRADDAEKRLLTSTSRIATLEAQLAEARKNARMPGTVEVCERHTLPGYCMTYPYNAANCPSGARGCPIRSAHGEKP